MSDISAERIGGWLLGPLAWLIVQLISISVTLVKFTYVLFSPQTLALLKTWAHPTSRYSRYRSSHSLPCGITRCG